ncbi:hypothetical protein GTO89_06180 [Heliobacterium gestii]|uniref:Uncharacterized protein n=1 Tax=Heliomicrobium gestii TaxID=2699 RepID=A0A845LDT8_HELGE|nr:hypothetical protein [Heliomicrobium gestii]MBM7866045.1 hypothetical protein [Heliomicrobium gestii]MZP42625.1 hypothetical protein [Heliomicrobium gestii]
MALIIHNCNLVRKKFFTKEGRRKETPAEAAKENLTEGRLFRVTKSAQKDNRYKNP